MMMIIMMMAMGGSLRRTLSVMVYDNGDYDHSDSDDDENDDGGDLSQLIAYSLDIDGR